MKSNSNQLFLGAAVAIFFALTFSAFAQDEKQTSTPPPPPAVSEQPPPATPASPAPAAVTPPAEPATPAPATAAAPEEKKEPELRRLDNSPTRKNSRSSSQRFEGIRIKGNGNEVVSVGHDSFLGKDQKADAVVSILGSSTSDGEVADAVVSILGDTRVTGPVGDSAVAVLGNTYVNSKIGGEAVAVLGDVELGPTAEVDGDVVSVGGVVKRDPGAIIHGNVQNVAFAGGVAHLDSLHAWFRECLLLGRPLGFAAHLGFAWMFAIAFLVLYLLVALVFGSGVNKCVTTLETRPGSSILTAILSVLLAPVLIVLLCITVIGIAAVPFLALGFMVIAIFGKTVMLAWVGRRITKFFGDGPLQHPVFAVLVGGVIVLLLYCVPFVGMLVQKTFELLGFGVVVFTLILANRREKPTPPPRPPVAPAPTSVVPPVPPTMPMSSPGFGASGIVAGEPAVAGAAAPVMPVVPPEPSPAVAAFAAPPLVTPVSPSISAATGTRAGFLIRLAALALDFILIGIVVSFFYHGGKFILIVVAAYAAVMWKLKGTTIGGIVCGLKVVRIDDRPVDWATAIVRALGCFLSLAVVGLGFLWVAIDDDKQSWHDKIAGTTVVRVPKGVSLI